MQTAEFVELLAVPQAQAKNPVFDIIIEGQSSFNTIARISRTSRLYKMIRLLRLLKILQIAKKNKIIAG